MKKLERTEEYILENGIKKAFAGNLEQIISEMTTLFRTNGLNLLIQEKIILIIKCDQSNEITMDDIGLINDSIQKNLENKVSIIMHIEENDFAKNNEYEISLHYFLKD